MLHAAHRHIKFLSGLGFHITDNFFRQRNMRSVFKAGNGLAFMMIADGAAKNSECAAIGTLGVGQQ